MNIMSLFFMRCLRAFHPAKCLFGLLLLVSLSSCESDCVYHDYQHLPNSMWGSRDTLCFRIPINDSLATYKLNLEMRHSTEFAYKEAFLMLESHYGKQHPQTRLFCFPVVAEDGRWLGTGWGSTLQLSRTLGQYRFVHPDTLVFRIYHSMNELHLNGISDIGLKVTIVSKHNRKE